MMLGKLPPTDALRLALLLCDETKRQTVMKMTELENAKLHRLVNTISMLNGHG